MHVTHLFGCSAGHDDAQALEEAGLGGHGVVLVLPPQEDGAGELPAFQAVLRINWRRYNNTYGDGIHRVRTEEDLGRADDDRVLSICCRLLFVPCRRQCSCVYASADWVLSVRQGEVLTAQSIRSSFWQSSPFSTIHTE